MSRAMPLKMSSLRHTTPSTLQESMRSLELLLTAITCFVRTHHIPDVCWNLVLKYIIITGMGKSQELTVSLALRVCDWLSPVF